MLTCALDWCMESVVEDCRWQNYHFGIFSIIVFQALKQISCSKTEELRRGRDGGWTPDCGWWFKTHRRRPIVNVYNN